MIPALKSVGGLIPIMLLLDLVAVFCSEALRTQEFQRYDGWYNNLANRDWGSAGSRLHRDSPSNYEDGVYMMNLSLPSARVLSELVFKGQVVAYEIMASTQTSCPLEIMKIPVPPGDPVYDINGTGTDIPFTRAKYDKQSGQGFNSPREQVNERTSWIDGSFVYSVMEAWVATMRSFENGTLKEGNQKRYPPLNNPHIPLNNPPPPQIHRLLNPDRLFLLGDSRVNENPGLLSFGIILYRWHNILAQKIQKENPSWTDEELFQAARRWLIATLQKIIFYDFLPALINEEVKPYTKYMPHVPPGISHAFAAAAFRFPHSIVPPAMILRKNVNACEWNAQDIVQEYTVDEIILGMASQVSEADDIIVVEDLRDYIFGPMHFTRLDVVASSIMRGRDNGLPSYNMLRKAFNLREKTWETINPKLYQTNKEMFDKLEALYGDIDYLDAYVGGMLEVNNGPGELFKAIIKDQFERLRDSDRFWFENRQNDLFTDEEIKKIHKTTLRDIIRETTEISDQWLQEDVFYFKEGLEQCVPFMRFDHFTGNEVTYIFTLIGLGCIPLICFGIGYMLIQRRRRMGWDSSYDDLSATAIDVSAFEWLQECFVRQVIVEISPGSLVVRKPRGGILRKMIFSENAKVLRLPSDKHLPEFLAALTLSLKKLDGQLICFLIPNKALLEKAETEERRQQRLDHFFREAYARAFNQPKLSDSNTHENDTDSILDQTITKCDLFLAYDFASSRSSPFFGVNFLSLLCYRHEFAQAIGMRETDMFVQRMFAITSHSSSDMVTFAEFLEVLKKFSEGTVRDKYKLLFAMCDIHGRGRVHRRQFAELIRSLNDVIGVRITESTHDNVIENILCRSGISPSSEYLTVADFEAIFAQVDERRPVCVDFRGTKIKVNLEETASLSSFAVSSAPERQCLPHDIFGSFAAYVETYRQHIAILFIFCCINIIVFLERFWHYRYETEHRDLRRVMGAGIAITRGAAGALSFCMAVVLLTVCRNVITLVRETPLGEFIPFDSAITFHKIVALFAAFWASLHTIGHCVNFYHVATQSQEGLHCLFQEAVFGSNFLPSICYWFYGTITGLTGILLVAVMSIIYVFALPCFMKRAYHAFRLTHLLNVAFYALTVLHGLPKLLDSPKFGYYVVGPVIIFIIDRIMGMRQEYKKLKIINAELLPSDIIYLQFKRPLSFSFRSGQWVRISSPAFSCAFNECHAFSLASAPQSPTLELYIKVVGPWTWKLRSEIIRAQASNSSYPFVHMNGPYGDGNQEWTNYEVAVLIGGGIGVTPYASTLTDLVYFLWICPTHKNYEWFIDVLKDVEELDQNRLIEGHIFVTQFFHKFDLRTTMLYICEKHFRGDHEGKSMFTGLRAHNHFGRPDFDAFFSYIQSVHNEISDIGIFSCGPSSLNDQISSACSRANRARNAPSLMHKFETF
ncbi:unnamed protein product [Angiostrongylus costaricensis]|uniref:FAD-binding FR-type domain-containing protein n=1 Tax=Angiostrongylus costaricensis TaxID=334426 RepID=A0A158PH60_ANGCS|nr:unnamed protein product [Angiostrongylus costaricensis]